MPELNKIAPQFCAQYAQYYVLGSFFFVQNSKCCSLHTQGLAAHDCGATKIEKILRTVVVVVVIIL